MIINFKNSQTGNYLEVKLRSFAFLLTLFCVLSFVFSCNSTPNKDTPTSHEDAPQSIDKVGKPAFAACNSNGKIYYSLNEGIDVEIECSTQDAEIYYTTDESEPNVNSETTLKYSSPIHIDSNTNINVIKAIATKNGFTTSDISVCEVIAKTKMMLEPTIITEGDYRHDKTKFDSRLKITINTDVDLSNYVNPKICYYFNDNKNPAEYKNQITVLGSSVNIINAENEKYITISAYILSDDTENPQVVTKKVNKMTKVTLGFDKSNDDYVSNVSISKNQNQAQVLYKINDSEPQVYTSAITFNGQATIEAYVLNNKFYSDTIKRTYCYDSTGGFLSSHTTLQNGTCKYSSIPYSTSYQGSDGKTEFNLYLPKPIGQINERKPVVVYVHGGSWTSGNQDEYERYFETGSEKYAQSYVQNYGLPVISIDYRHIGSGGKKLTTHTNWSVDVPFKMSGSVETPIGYYLFDDNSNRITDQVGDILACFNYIKQNAELLNIDDSYCIMDGYSAGANLELLYVLDDSVQKPIPVKALIDRLGPSDMSSYEYVKFFSDQLTHGEYNYTASIAGSNVDVNLQMINGDNDGEKFLIGMIQSATGLNKTFDEIKALALAGLDSAPNEIKAISPAAKVENNKNWSGNGSITPYVVMAYGNDVDLTIGVKDFDIYTLSASADADLKGDPLAPRKAGELLAKRLNSLASISLISFGDDDRIAKNAAGQTYCFYKGDIEQGQYLSFIGSSAGGHDIASKQSDQSFSKHWSDAELASLNESVEYALETVCGLSKI